MAFASICEDLPDAVGSASGASMGVSTSSTRSTPPSATDVASMRKLVIAALAPYRYQLIKQAENPGLLAHACSGHAGRHVGR